MTPIRCPNCEFTYAWDGEFCGHCQRPYPLRNVWNAAAAPGWFTGHHLATHWELVLVGCGSVRTIERLLPPETGPALYALERAALAHTGTTRACGELARVVESVRATAAQESPALLAADALSALANAAVNPRALVVPEVTQLVAVAEARARVPVTADERYRRPTFIDAAPHGSDLQWAVQHGHEPPSLTAAEQEDWDRWRAATRRADTARRARMEAATAVSAALCDVYRDVVEYPFVPVAFDPAWRTSTAVAMAKGFIEAADFSAMPILADALQDAGCDDPEVLEHCRSDRRHYRGCWVVERVLGRG